MMRLSLFALVIAIVAAENVTTCRVIHADIEEIPIYIYSPHEYISGMNSMYQQNPVTPRKVHTDIDDLFYMILYDNEDLVNMFQRRIGNTYSDPDGIIMLKNSVYLYYQLDNMYGLQDQQILTETCPNVICSYNNWPYDYGQCVNADGQNQICCEDGWQICGVCDESICC